MNRQAWRSFHRFEAGTNCRAWLYKILLFTYSAQNRKRARQPFLVDLDAAGETALLVDAPTPDTLTAEAVKAALDRLPENFRTLVLLVDVEGLTYREAAEALNVPLGTVMSRLSRARGLLRVELARHAPESCTAARRGMDPSAQRRARS
jgi:RNA polymerase sigma-70 factor, ECF subfamily